MARLGLWQRLMLLIGGTVALMWLALALTSITFARFQTQFSGLAASQVPRIALTAELAGHSAQLAGLTTRIIGGEGETQLAEVAAVADRLNAALDQLKRDLAGLPPLYERRKWLDESITRDIDTLRWLITTNFGPCLLLLPSLGAWLGQRRRAKRHAPSPA